MTIGILNPLKSQDIRIVSAPRTDNGSVGDCFANSSAAVRAFRSPGVAGAFANSGGTMIGGSSAPANGRTVRRCLFGPTNHDETMDFLNGELATLRERQKRKWDFDFVREQPAESSEKYVWERIEQSEPAQASAAGDSRTSERLDCCHSDGSAVDDKMDAGAMDGLCDKLEAADEKCNGRICTKYRQTTMNEYWRCSKRPSSCLQCSFSTDCRINNSSRDKKTSTKKETTSGQALKSEKNSSNSTIVNNNSSNGSNSIDHSPEDAAVPNKKLCKITC